MVIAVVGAGSIGQRHHRNLTALGEAVDLIGWRSFDKAKFEEKKQRFHDAASAIRAQYGDDAIEVELNDQYYNMGEKITPVMEIVDHVKAIMEDLEIEPLIIPIRGGTDGSQLSYMGMPTPNIFTGGENYHGKFEYISIENMEKATQVVQEIIKRAALK